ncbi:MAG: hypothetical protein H6850_02040 [Alphaproteobacteria bacterium]|nr:MAG: hypothetical protein H6850_02040 [Alphaproteobacteria bacterium]
MTTICVKSNNKTMLWNAFNDMVSKYASDYTLDTRDCSTIIAYYRDLASASQVVLKALNGKNIIFMDYPHTKSDRRRLTRLSDMYNFHEDHSHSNSTAWVWIVFGLSFLFLMAFLLL